MSDLPERLLAFYDSMNAPPSPGLPDGAEVVLEARAEIERLREALRRANEATAPYANHFGVAKHVADITKEALRERLR